MMMKAWTLLVAGLGAAPVAASILTGPYVRAEKDYGSERKCERALLAMVQAELATPQTDGRTATVAGRELSITTYVAPVTATRTFRCRYKFLAETFGSVMPSNPPPPPPSKP